MARHVIVRYRVKPERLEEHLALVRAVFAELAETAPAGIRYGAFQRADRLSFVHVAHVSAAANPLQALASFRAFTEKVAERCDEPPETTELTPVGTYEV
jgi:hypothetical protein